MSEWVVGGQRQAYGQRVQAAGDGQFVQKALMHPNAPLRVAYLLPILEALERRDPEHPLLAVFLPYRVADRQRLRREGPEALARIEAAPLPPRVRECLSDVFFSWLTLRFSDQPFQGDYSRGVFPLSNFAVET